jgi:endonuclease/exonuclease/phosphatase family metal-dependent hydrolase
MLFRRCALVVLSLALGACGPPEEVVVPVDSATAPHDAAVVPDEQVAPPDATALVDGTATVDLAIAPPDLVGVDQTKPPPTRLRIVAANLTSGNLQTYEQPGINILQGLKPDVVLIQEFNVGDRRVFVDTALGQSFAYFVEPTIGLPNGVISRYPIVSSGNWVDSLAVNRSFVWAQIDIPGPVDLWAVSVHLLTTGSTARASEVGQLIGYIDSVVPSGDYLVVGGDFNTDNNMEAALMDFSSTVVVMPPFPVDQLNNASTSGNRTKPYDWVLVNPDLDALSTAVTMGTSTYPYGLVFDSRVYTPLTDVPPILATDSAAPNMQHMAVVRDFLVD